MEYRVRYEIDVDAESPLEAAKEVYEMMIDPTASLPVLTVCELLGVKDNEEVLGPETEIDLQAEDDYEELRRHDALDRN